MSEPTHLPTPAASPFAESLPQVFGRYLLLQRLSSGGMGEIFLAKHGLPGFEKICVIKKVLPHLSQDEHFISRFVDEAQVAIQLQHANIAQVFEVGRVEDNYFLSLEFVEGYDLRRILNQLATQQRCFPVDMALFIVREIASGLAYAHRRRGADGKALGLVHCDISPPNVVLSFDGEIKVIDFGIAKSALQGTTTDPKIGFGKLGYMAPEQLLRGGRIDHRTDVYAAGAVLFEVLTGMRLYSMDNADYKAVARKVIRGEYLRPSQINASLAPYDAIVAKALQPDPTRRFQSAADLRDAIQTALVQINPTISGDQLGTFVDSLFAGAKEEIEQLTARAHGADLGPWQDELTHRMHETVSFARASLGHAPLGLAARPRQTSDRTEIVRRGHRSPRVILTTAAAMLSGVFLLSMVFAGMGADSSDPPPVESAVIANQAQRPIAALDGPGADELAQKGQQVATATTGQSVDLNGAEPASRAPRGDQRTDVKRAAADATQPREAGKTLAARNAPSDSDNAADSTAPAARKDTARERRSRRGRLRRKAKNRGARRDVQAVKSDSEPQSPPKSEQPSLSSEQVASRFRALSREYRQFRASYGPRLETLWNDIAQTAQYAGSDPKKLRKLSRQLDRFRQRMRQIKRNGDP